jgi:hypothetical protein
LRQQESAICLSPPFGLTCLQAHLATHNLDTQCDE